MYIIFKVMHSMTEEKIANLIVTFRGLDQSITNSPALQRSGSIKNGPGKERDKPVTGSVKAGPCGELL